MDRKVKITPYKGPAGGWGSVNSLAEITRRERPDVSTAELLYRQNKPHGFMCVSCAWSKPAKPHPAEFCENGGKATIWERTRDRTTPAFFAEHTVTELLGWSDYELEMVGRLTHPLRYDPATDKYVETRWDEAFAAIGRELKPLDPKAVVFYASGRASLETSYMYALMARLYGNNNLPDSSNMCHETTSVALKEVIGSPVGTVIPEDFETTDCMIFFGQNTASNSPRMLHELQDAAKRGVPIIVFNPLKERGHERFTNPQSPTEMATGAETPIASQYLQVKAGGDIAALMGLCKYAIEADDRARADGDAPILDHAFIAQHTHGFEAFAQAVRATSWTEIERHSGLARRALEQAGEVYCRARSVIGLYGMGLTQHVGGEQNCKMVVNLLLLRGNIGRPGAGVCPVRGHSNVQGQRTVGIAEKPELVPLDRLAEQYGFQPPREKGHNTVETAEALLRGEVAAFIGLGGNFVRAIPDTEQMERAWRTMRLTVQIATKLNRSHLVNGEVAYLLPCLGRSEQDMQASGRQAVTMEDSLSHIHGSIGDAPPASEHLLSEPAIVAGLAKAILEPNPKVDWDGWLADYDRIRDSIEETYPDKFKDFNARMFNPGGFYKGVPAHERQWETESGRADFTVPTMMSATGFEDGLQARGEVMRLVTLRSNDQFNTTVYGYDDRFRGIKGTREVVLMNRRDIDRMGLCEGQTVTLVGDSRDQVVRERGGLRIIAYDIPEGCVGGYYPECNGLIPVWHYAAESKTPAAKSVPVTIRR